MPWSYRRFQQFHYRSKLSPGTTRAEIHTSDSAEKKKAESTSWISSMVVLENPEKIICLDPQDLNKAIQRPKYQMPTLEEILPKLSKAKVFTTLDAKDGFYQIGFEKETSRKTTFWTPFGRYRYLTMPFGINLTPKEFNSK